MRHGQVTEDRRAELTDDLPEIARHTSERERRADDAERELVQWKKVRFMADKVGDEFDGYITGVSAFGLYIELVEHFVEGMVHVSTMADDYYRFVDKAHVLKGENTGKIYRLGDRVSVQVVKVDMERRQIDLGLTEILDRVRDSERNRGSAPQQSGAAPRAGGAPRILEAGQVETAEAAPGKEGAGIQTQAMSGRSIVVGTAGHIDHGKSALVRALTGIDPDRLKEETRKGHHDRSGFRPCRSGRYDSVVRRRPGPRALRQEHAGGRRRHRPRDAGGGGGRVRDAANA